MHSISLYQCHINTQSWETEWIPEIQLSISLNTRGIQQKYKIWSAGTPVLTKSFVLKLENLRVYKTYCLCESLTVLFLMSLKKFLLRQKKICRLLIETE